MERGKQIGMDALIIGAAAFVATPVLERLSRRRRAQQIPTESTSTSVPSTPLRTSEIRATTTIPTTGPSVNGATDRVSSTFQEPVSVIPEVVLAGNTTSNSIPEAQEPTTVNRTIVNLDAADGAPQAAEATSSRPVTIDTQTIQDFERQLARQQKLIESLVALQNGTDTEEQRLTVEEAGLLPDPKAAQEKAAAIDRVKQDFEAKMQEMEQRFNQSQQELEQRVAQQNTTMEMLEQHLQSMQRQRDEERANRETAENILIKQSQGERLSLDETNFIRQKQGEALLTQEQYDTPPAPEPAPVPTLDETDGESTRWQNMKERFRNGWNRLLRRGERPDQPEDDEQQGFLQRFRNRILRRREPAPIEPTLNTNYEGLYNDGQDLIKRASEIYNPNPAGDGWRRTNGAAAISSIGLSVAARASARVLDVGTRFLGIPVLSMPVAFLGSLAGSAMRRNESNVQMWRRYSNDVGLGRRFLRGAERRSTRIDAGVSRDIVAPVLDATAAQRASLTGQEQRDFVERSIKYLASTKAASDLGATFHEDEIEEYNETRDQLITIVNELLTTLPGNIRADIITNLERQARNDRGRMVTKFAGIAAVKALAFSEVFVIGEFVGAKFVDLASKIRGVPLPGSGKNPHVTTSEHLTRTGKGVFERTTVKVDGHPAASVVEKITPRGKEVLVGKPHYAVNDPRLTNYVADILQEQDGKKDLSSLAHKAKAITGNNTPTAVIPKHPVFIGAPYNPHHSASGMPLPIHKGGGRPFNLPPFNHGKVNLGHGVTITDRHLRNGTDAITVNSHGKPIDAKAMHRLQHFVTSHFGNAQVDTVQPAQIHGSVSETMLLNGDSLTTQEFSRFITDNQYNPSLWDNAMQIAQGVGDQQSIDALKSAGYFKEVGLTYPQNIEGHWNQMMNALHWVVEGQPIQVEHPVSAATIVDSLSGHPVDQTFIVRPSWNIMSGVSSLPPTGGAAHALKPTA